MSDYCKGCAYDKKARVGDKACPFNALYWDFFDRNRTRLGTNHRLGMVFKQLARFDDGTRAGIRQPAKAVRRRLDTL